MKNTKSKAKGDAKGEANLWIGARATDGARTVAAAASDSAGAVIRHGAVVAGRNGTEGVVIEADADR